MSVQVRVALDKEAHPDKYCPARRCLWRTGDGTRCPRHPVPNCENGGTSCRDCPGCANPALGCAC